MLRRARVESVRARESPNFLTTPHIYPQLTHMLSYSLIPLQWGAVHICRNFVLEERFAMLLH